MVNRNFYRSGQRRQKGVVAIEFVFIFPVLFVICYATIAYALAFLVVQNMTYTSEEVLRKALGSEYDICENEDETEQTTQKIAECKIVETYGRYSANMLVFVDTSDSDQYTKIASCDSNLICTLEIRGKPLTSASIFGFTLFDLSNNPDNKLVSRASLLF
ncbi:MAG: pilus assembly protein [Zhongshania sp.]|nr:pilus assembly protein [Zhongshania sp.]